MQFFSEVVLLVRSPPALTDHDPFLPSTAPVLHLWLLDDRAFEFTVMMTPEDLKVNGLVLGDRIVDTRSEW